jgi:hypothetical protein
MAAFRFRMLLVGCAACSPTLPPPPLSAAPAAAHDTEQSHLLLFPQADAEALLGRAVQRSSDGSWTMADARAPGCEVQVTREKAAFHTSRKIDVHAMTSLAGGYARLVSMEVRFGRQNRANLAIDNREILHADLRGACGELAVDTVFVGHGRRWLEASSDMGASADVHVGVVNAAPQVSAGQSQDDALEWTDDQAYGFGVTQNAKTEPLDVRVDLPSIVNEGENVSAQFTADREAWLVVYYLDAEGHANVLWPSNEEPTPHVTPQAPATLPSQRERANNISIRAALLKPGQPARETLVVYAFADKRDFDVLKPAAGSESADGAAYAAELTKKLQTVPISRWSRAVVGYVIQPKT